jgi:dTDP-4-amino-4,6-dideoxygalactose transaminase
MVVKVPYFKGQMGADELERVASVLESGWLTTGKVTAEFENKFARFCSVSHALATNSCTAALHLALEALGIGPGDKVIVPTLTFTASAEVIRYLGADPVFVDVDAETCLITADSIRTQVAIHDSIKACVVVHFAGQSVEMTGENGVWETCQKLGIRLVQDAAHAFPSRDQYGPIGSIGDVTCFSFYANKTITTGEGGMLITNDDDIAHRVKVMRLHGIDRDIWNRFTSDKPSWEYDVVAPGYKYNMPDINAAIGVVQLDKAESMRKLRQEIAEKYLDSFSEQDCYRVIRSRVKLDEHAWHIFPIILQGNLAGSRDRVISMLGEKGIGTSIHYKPLHRMSYYRERYSLDAGAFPNSESYWQNCISLPIFPGMTSEQTEYVVQSLVELGSV